MTKKLFIESIEQIQKQFEHNKKCSAAFEVILPDNYIHYYPESFITNQLIKILTIQTQDKGEWIDYYIYELDFGKKWKKGMVTGTDKKDIKLKTPLDLWNIIKKESE